jgi:hypothetical protein
VAGWSAAATSAWLDELTDAAERSGVSGVEAEVTRGGIVDTLLDRAAAARMLVLGSYGEAAWRGCSRDPSRPP